MYPTELKLGMFDHMDNSKHRFLNICRCAFKKCFPKKFEKFTGKYLCQSLFKYSWRLQSTTLFKKRLSRRCFSANVAKFLRTTFLQTTSGWLHLHGPCIIFTTLRAIDGFLINKYLARLMALLLFIFQIWKKLLKILTTLFVDRTYCQSIHIAKVVHK